MLWKTGGCHCGSIKFRVLSDFKKAYICNCSICTQKGFLHLIVSKNEFELISSASNLSTYTFGTHIAKHLFCSKCGISSYYIPRSHPDGFSVNLRCVEDIDLKQIEFIPFDGKNWDMNIHLIK